MLKVAHINRRGNDMIIVPLDESFGDFDPAQRDAILKDMRDAARRQGLGGTVVPVWPSDERLRFLAPKPWHPFFGSMSWDWLVGNLNREIVV